jgi:hypothetical protein
VAMQDLPPSLLTQSGDPVIGRSEDRFWRRHLPSIFLLIEDRATDLCAPD